MKISFVETPKTIRQKIGSWLLCFSLMFQAVAPAYAAIPSGTLEGYLNSEPGIVQDSFLVYKPNIALRAIAPNADSAQDFYTQLQAIQPGAISGELGRLVGDEVVQSRLIRTQLQIMTGRSLLDKIDNPLPVFYTNEENQLSGLYQNALSLINSELSGYSFGEPLNRSPIDSALSLPLVWPEYRTIRGMDNVLVPVLYLPENYYNTLDIRENSVAVRGDVMLANLIINDAVLLLGQQDALVQVTNDLINNGGTIRSEENLAITVGNAFKNLGGTISAVDDLVIGAHSVENQTLLYQYDTDVGMSTVYGEIAGLESDNGNVRVRSYSDLVFLGSRAQAPNGEITLAADGNIILDSGEIVEVARTAFGDGSSTTSEVTYLQSELGAKETIELIAGGSILIEGANIHSDQGHINILASMGITIIDEQGVSQSQASGSFGKKDVTESVYQTIAIRSILDAGKGVRLHTDIGDINLRATDISTLEGTSVNAQNGALNLLTSVETDHYAYSSVKEGLFTTKTENRGRNIETGVPNSIVGGFAVEAAKSIHVEYTGDPNLSLDEQVAVLAQMPGLKWMAEVRGLTTDVDWTLIETKYEEWNESSTSLSPAFAAVIAIAVAVLTQDYSGQLAASILGSAATTTTTVVTAAGAASVTSASTLAIAVQAGITSFFTQGALAAGNGIVNGDIVGAMEDFASDETLKNIAVAMVTAGAIETIDAEFFDYLNADRVPLERVAQAKDLALGEQAIRGIYSSIVRAGVADWAFDANFDDSFQSALLSYAGERIGESMARSIGVAYKASPQDGFDNAMRYIAHAAAGCVTGVIRGASQSSVEERENYCVSGAGGAVVGEFVGDLYNQAIGYDEKVQAVDELGNRVKALQDQAVGISADMSEEEKAAVAAFMTTGDYGHLEILSEQHFNDIVDYAYQIDTLTVSQREIASLARDGVDLAKLTAGFAALLAEVDVDTAAYAGANAAENNALWFAVIPIIKFGSALLTAYGAYQLTVELQEIWEEYGDDLLSEDSEVSGAAAEALALDLAEKAGVAGVENLVEGAALYGAVTLFEKATKWDKVAGLIHVLEKAGQTSVAQLNELKALYFKRGNFTPGDGADSFDKIYFTTPEMDADPYHPDWLRYGGARSVGAGVRIIVLSKARFGHTFSVHGQEQTQFLTRRAAGAGMPQGQFLDNQAAARLIEENLDNLHSGAISVPVSEGFPARIINPDGTYTTPSSIRLVPGKNGVKTAYPEP